MPSSSKPYVIIGALVAIAATIAVVLAIMSQSAPKAQAEGEDGNTAAQEQAAEGSEAAEQPRFEVEGAPAGVARHHEIVKDNTTGREYMIVFEGGNAVAFELNPEPVKAPEAGVTGAGEAAGADASETASGSADEPEETEADAEETDEYSY